MKLLGLVKCPIQRTACQRAKRAPRRESWGRAPDAFRPGVFYLGGSGEAEEVVVDLRPSDRGRPRRKAFCYASGSDEARSANVGRPVRLLTNYVGHVLCVLFSLIVD